MVTEIELIRGVGLLTLAMRRLTILSLVLLSMIASTSASNVIINLTTAPIDGNPVTLAGVESGPPSSEPVVGGFIHNGFFRRTVENDDSGSGSGRFRDLYRVDDLSTPTDPEDGYNRVAFPDVSIPNGFFPELRVAGLLLQVSAAGDSFAFMIDTNESVGGNGRFISLDDLRVYVGSNTDPNPLPNSVSLLNQLGTPVYLMNAPGEQSHVLIDSSLFSGSGEMDALFFLPASLFRGFAPDSFVYIYTSWGQYSFMDDTRTLGFGSSAGPEHFAGAISAFPSYVPVPEPAGTAFIIAAATMGAFRRRRRI